MRLIQWPEQCDCAPHTRFKPSGRAVERPRSASMYHVLATSTHSTANSAAGWSPTSWKHCQQLQVTCPRGPQDRDDATAARPAFRVLVVGRACCTAAAPHVDYALPIGTRTSGKRSISSSSSASAAAPCCCKVPPTESFPIRLVEDRQLNGTHPGTVRVRSIVTPAGKTWRFGSQAQGPRSMSMSVRVAKYGHGPYEYLSTCLLVPWRRRLTVGKTLADRSWSLGGSTVNREPCRGSSRAASSPHPPNAAGNGRGQLKSIQFSSAPSCAHNGLAGDSLVKVID